MKKILFTVVLSAVVAAGGWAFAHGNTHDYGRMANGSYAMMGGGGGGMMGGGMMGGGGYGRGGGGYGMMGGGSSMGGGGYGYGGNRGHSGYSDQGRNNQNSMSNAQNQRFMDATVGLRRKLNEKRFEYREAQRNPSTSRERLSRLHRQIQDLQTELDRKAEQYR